MEKHPLHVTNGSVLTNRLNELNVEGDIITWQEMLCEGSTVEQVYSEEFSKIRKDFFSSFYDVELNISEIETELEKLNHPENYSEIILWFEYDLFCHINMIAVISLIKQKKIKLPLYLVCSGKVERNKHLKGLAELNSGQLLKHFRDKVALTPEDLDMATNAWSIYCGMDHNLLKPLIVQKSSFKYLSNCLKAHLERFPETKDGLNVMERNILEIVRDKTIKSRHHLLGYALNYQGYYGYGDMQVNRIIEKLSIFFIEEENLIKLSRYGHEALLGLHNFAFEIDNAMTFGGVRKLDFQFNKKENKLIKTINNAH
ncbi:hypothetical protein EV196_10688 [Mariniflexile fucanivorans]|uniref:DUF1835 domain-containing protein n=1 Tax=Mariniflexile fucanivorans TaxID=264023 RepID=A0A4R1RG62_9FLAO|nr:DUF1835 domain-containing protein [Mariniflexile fucanivorans]TCL64899.1 hypothetical protein EV196_10688 [Mariniflexile fucanivorans]